MILLSASLLRSMIMLLPAIMFVHPTEEPYTRPVLTFESAIIICPDP
jgi:hypothetical protein